MKSKRQMIPVFLTLVLTLSVLATGVFAADAADFAGKKVSVLGDSISTYTGVSNDATMNSTIGSNAIYYTAGKLGVYRPDTWWQQAVDLLDMELLVNNAWSGSAIHAKRNGAEAAYKDRCVQLHDDIDNVDPDVIWSFLGTNDFSWYASSKWGTVNAIDFDTLIVAGANGYTYATPSTVYEAYAIMLHKMTQRYPAADIYVMSLLSRRDPVLPSSYVDNGQPTVINAGIKQLAELMGCTFVDLESRITSDPADFDLCIGDQKVHPNPTGHDRITAAVVSAMLGEESVFTVTDELLGADSENGACLVLADSKYESKISVSAGYASADITVTMGDKDITDECYKNGTVTIDSVSGDIVLSGRGTAAFTGSYRWEMNAAGDAFVSVTEGGNTANALTLTNGSVSGGKMTQACFALDDTVYLLPTEEWAIEWQVNGDWKGLLFCTNDANTSGMTYIFRSGSSALFALGTYDGSWRNYGLSLPSTFDETAQHSYRIENRIAADGGNMAYLVIDDMEFGSLNNYYSGTTNKNTVNNWIDGTTLAFNHMGKVANSHYLTMEMDYVQVWASGPAEHKHAYVIIESSTATCCSDGVVTYSCTTCGHSYSEVSKADESLHSFGPWLREEQKLHRTCRLCKTIESKDMLAYRWEMNAAGNALESVTTNGNTSNLLTKTNGSISDGVLTTACFAMQDTVTLLPTDEWVIEWKASGDWKGLLLCTNDTNVSGMTYLYRNNKVPFFALGEMTSTWHNYAVVDPADTETQHVYRVENRVEGDTNTAYLVIDGVEIGAMTAYYEQAVNKNTTVNWINGKTLIFNHMGKVANNHYLSMDLEYLQIWTNGEPAEPAAEYSVSGDTFSVTLNEGAQELVRKVIFAAYETDGQLSAAQVAAPENGAVSFARGALEGNIFFLDSNGEPVLNALRVQ